MTLLFEIAYEKATIGAQRFGSRSTVFASARFIASGPSVPCHGAVEAGALPGLLPIGRWVGDPKARAEVARVWAKATLPTTPGRSTAAMLAAAEQGELGALIVAGVDAADLPDPAGALRALETVPFVVSLELRASSVTDRADVVFPVAAIAEKAGTFVNWEGRGGTFGAALTVPGVRTDQYVLGAIGRASCRERVLTGV